jgi:hypothetical protein
VRVAVVRGKVTSLGVEVGVEKIRKSEIIWGEGDDNDNLDEFDLNFLFVIYLIRILIELD